MSKKNLIQLSKILDLYGKSSVGMKASVQRSGATGYKGGLPTCSTLGLKVVGTPHPKKDSRASSSVNSSQQLNNTIKALKGSLKTLVRTSSPEKEKRHNKVISSLKKAIQESTKHALHNPQYLYFNQPPKSPLNSRKPLSKANRSAQSSKNFLKSPLLSKGFSRLLLKTNKNGDKKQVKKERSVETETRPLSLTLRVLNKVLSPNGTKRVTFPGSLMKKFGSRSTKQFGISECTFIGEVVGAESTPKKDKVVAAFSAMSTYMPYDTIASQNPDKRPNKLEKAKNDLVDWIVECTQVQ